MIFLICVNCHRNAWRYGSGVNIYTHGEMLPAHGYPGLKKYSHLAGNYGSAWQNQAVEFEAFPGAILMTTNCIQGPRETYKARIFTTGLVAWPGVTHIQDRDFKPLIEAALEAPGFAADEPERTIMVGFGHNTILGVADRVIDAVKTKSSISMSRSIRPATGEQGRSPEAWTNLWKGEEAMLLGSKKS